MAINIKNRIFHQRLLEVLAYNPKTGIFIWKEKPCKKIHIGDIAGTERPDGHCYITIRRQIYATHHLAWFYTHKKWVDGDIDHKDHNPSNNSIKNLRPATRKMNAENRSKANKNSQTGLLGAHPSHKKWASQIKVQGVQIHLGTFDSPEKAHEAYLQAKKELHKGYLE